MVRLSAASVGFGAVLRGNSAIQSVTVTNIGGRTLNIGSVSATGDYSQTHTCAAPVAPDQSCTITVTFDPQRLGNRDGVLSIGSNATPASNTVDLSGTGCQILSLAAMRFIVSACGN